MPRWGRCTAGILLVVAEEGIVARKTALIAVRLMLSATTLSTLECLQSNVPFKDNECGSRGASMIVKR